MISDNENAKAMGLGSCSLHGIVISHELSVCIAPNNRRVNQIGVIVVEAVATGFVLEFDECFHVVCTAGVII